MVDNETQTEHQLFLCEATDSAAAMYNGRGDIRIFFLHRDTTPAEKAEIEALRLVYLGVFGVCDGKPKCKLADGVDYLSALKAGHLYGQMLAAKRNGDGVAWLADLHTLQDPRTEN